MSSLGLFIMVLSIMIVASVCEKFAENGKRAGWVVWSIFSIVFLVGLWVNEAGIKKELDAKIAQEVSMTDVPVKGEKHFVAKVIICYKDGKLKGVEFVKDTTQPLQ